ncbi:MAG TPA: hypothetical protein VGR58_02190 [Candidatus Acidoferrum sp.]|nr:hypothetical protein [Candidatus Acidoferrum sp.]
MSGLNDSMRDAGTSGAACRVRTCGSAGGREVKKHDKGHTVGRAKNKSEKKKRRSAAADGSYKTGPPEGGRYNT